MILSEQVYPVVKSAVLRWANDAVAVPADFTLRLDVGEDPGEIQLLVPRADYLGQREVGRLTRSLPAAMMGGVDSLPAECSMPESWHRRTTTGTCLAAMWNLSRRLSSRRPGSD